MKGKVAIVTGATSGIGKAIAIELARQGASLVISGRSSKKGLETLQELKKINPNTIFLACDVSKSTEVENLIIETIKIFGKLDIAINNAGTLDTQLSLLDFPEEKWDEVININLKGVWLCMKYQIPEMLKNQNGSILNMSSVAGPVGGYRGLVAYSASKHGIIGLSKSAALEYASKGIRINVLCPGTVSDTGMLSEVINTTKNPSEALSNMPNFYPMKRLATPEEVAKSAVWLVSDEASFVTGTAIPVDGGFLAQ